VVLEVWDWDRLGGHDFMGQSSVSLRELRDAGERQLMLETRGNAKEEVKVRIPKQASVGFLSSIFLNTQGGLLVSATTSSESMRGSLATRSGSSLSTDSSLASDKMGMLSIHRAAMAGESDKVALWSVPSFWLL
jgi:proline racemase